MPSQVTLVYNVNVGFQSAVVGSKAYNRIANLDWDPGAEVASFLGMTLAAISQSQIADSTVRVEMIYSLEPAALVSFPNDELIKKATRNLFGRIYESQIPAEVTAEEPVVS